MTQRLEINQPTASPQPTSPLSRWVVFLWQTFRTPKFTLAILGVIILMASLGVVLPQQSQSVTEARLWVSTLSATWRPWGDVLFASGLSQIFQSLWFWLPVAGLLLNSLLALADYTILAWQRWQQKLPLVAWQHPLARRVEEVVELPTDSLADLSQLKQTFREAGFTIQETTAEQWTASKRTVGWFGPSWLYLGLIILVIGLLVSRYSLETDRFVLFPEEANTRQLLAGSFELTEVEAGQGTVIYQPTQATDPGPPQDWQLYRPQLVAGVLLLPIAFEPVLAVEVQNEAGELLRLLPIQEDLSPSERLYLSFNQTNEPLLFEIPTEGLTFQITPDQDNRYNVQARHRAESSPSTNLTVESGETFAVGELAGALNLSYTVRVVAYRDPAILLYGLAMVLLIGGAGLMILRRPVQLWFIPESWPTGGRLYGVGETFGASESLRQLLTDNLATLSPMVEPSDNETSS